MSDRMTQNISRNIFLVLKNAAYLYGTRLVDTAVRAIYLIILARFLGSADYGLLSYAQSYYLALLFFAGLGLNVILAKAVGQGRKELSSMMQCALAMRIIALCVLAFICLVSAWLLHSSLHVRVLLSVFSIALIARGLAFWARQVFIAVNQSRIILLLNVITRPMELGLVVLLLMREADLLSVAIIHGLVWCFEAAVAFVLIRRLSLPIRPNWDQQALAALFKRGLPLGLLSGLTNLLFVGPLVLFPHLTNDPFVLGQFAILLQALLMLGGFGWSIGFAVLPSLSREQGRGTLSRRYADISIRVGWLFGVLGIIAGHAFGPILSYFLLGPEYTVVGNMLGMTFVALGPLIAGTTLSQILLANESHKLALACVLIGIVSMAVSAMLMIPSYGMLGGLITLVLGVSLWAIAVIVMLLQSGCLNFHMAVTRPACVTMLALSSYLFLNKLHPNFSVAGAVIILVYFSIKCGVISRTEWSWIMQRMNVKRLIRYRFKG